jgi:hypothetical protein
MNLLRSQKVKYFFHPCNAPQNISKIKCTRSAKNAFVAQHLLHHSIIYTFIYYHTMNENRCISELIATEQVTFFLLVTNFWYFSTPVHGGPKGLLHTDDSIFIKFVSCECKKACQTKRCSYFKAKIWIALNQCSNSENNEIWMKINWQCQWLWWGGSGLWWLCSFTRKES